MILVFLWQVPLAYMVDLLVGDPRWLPHPVVIMGKAIDFWQQKIRSKVNSITCNKSNRKISRRTLETAAGAFLALGITGAAYFFTIVLLKIAGELHCVLEGLLSVWLISTTMAVRGLAGAAVEIEQLLKKGDASGARKKVALIVGRDADSMSLPEIVRATVETVAENTVDAVVSPVFYAFIGGAPLAMAYRAVNTLDSMVGYRDPEHRYVGCASARLDDAVNYIPARLTGLLLTIAAFLTGEKYREACKVVLRDAFRHPSPNSGIPEAAVAGALGVRLGGVNYYRGVRSFRPYIGDVVEELGPEHIGRSVRLMSVAGILSVAAGTVVLLVYHFIVLVN